MACFRPLPTANRSCPCLPFPQNGPEYMWTGDRWQSAPNLIKGWDFQVRLVAFTKHKPAGFIMACGDDERIACANTTNPRPQYWTVLQFDDSQSPPVPRQLQWQDTFTIDVL